MPYSNRKSRGTESPFEQGAVLKPAAWYAELIDSLPVGIYRSTLEGKIVYCNKGFAGIFGFDSVAGLIDYPVVDLYWDKKDRGDLINSVMEKGYAEEAFLLFKKKLGTPVWCAVTVNPVYDEDGLVVFLDGVIRDITDEIEERDSASTVNKMVQSMNDLIFILDLKGDLLDINGPGTQLLGYMREEILGRPMADFMSHRDRDFFPVFIYDIIRGGREEGLVTILDKNGAEHYMEFHAFLVKKKGGPHHIKSVARDVTERIRTQREQLKKMKLQGVLEMAGGVAHKLNQPLTVINHLINDLLTQINPEDAAYQKTLQIRLQVKRLNEIAKKIRGIRRYEAMEYVGGVKIVDIDKAS
jgi:PAS domain S-box-containing protein